MLPRRLLLPKNCGKAGLACFLLYNRIANKQWEGLLLTDITLRYLESFVAVVKYGGFTDAAKNVYRAQSSISSNILALEESLGVRLIDRTQKKSLVLTPDGKTFYRYASELLAQFRAIESHYSETVRPSLRAGAPGWTVGPLLSGAAYVSAAFPGCDCSVITGSSEEITQQLLQGDMQFALTESADCPQQLVYELYSRTPLVLVCPPSEAFEPLLQSDEPLREFLSVPTVSLLSTMTLQKKIDARFLSLYGRCPSSAAVFTVSDVSALLDAAESGCGAAIVPRAAAASRIAAGRLRCAETGEAELVSEIFLAYSRKLLRTPLDLKFLEYFSHQRKASPADGGDA